MVIGGAEHRIFPKNEREHGPYLGFIDQGADHIEDVYVKWIFPIERGQKFRHVLGVAGVYERHDGTIADVNA